MRPCRSRWSSTRRSPCRCSPSLPASRVRNRCSTAAAAGTRRVGGRASAESVRRRCRATPTALADRRRTTSCTSCAIRSAAHRAAGESIACGDCIAYRYDARRGDRDRDGCRARGTLLARAFERGALYAAAQCLGVAERMLELGGRVRERAQAVRPGDRRLPGAEAPARQRAGQARVRAPGRLCRCRALGGAGRCGARGAFRTQSSPPSQPRTLRAHRDPGARRHGIFLGGRPALLHEARLGARGRLGRPQLPRAPRPVGALVGRAAPRSGAHVCATEG